jgi:hypothetical protein
MDFGRNTRTLQANQLHVPSRQNRTKKEHEHFAGWSAQPALAN